MSPYLFILVMEILSCLISRAKDGGFTEGFRVKERNDARVKVSHLFFADDTLIFCDASKENLEYLSWVFMWFEVCSGLKINLEEFAEVLGCKVGSLPSTYLSLPLGAPYKSSKVWEGVEERFKKRLALWKRQYLSKGRRQTLIKSTLSSLPIYFMSLLLSLKE